MPTSSETSRAQNAMDVNVRLREIRALLNAPEQCDICHQPTADLMPWRDAWACAECRKVNPVAAPEIAHRIHRANALADVLEKYFEPALPVLAELGEKEWAALASAARISRPSAETRCMVALVLYQRQQRRERAKAVASVA